MLEIRTRVMIVNFRGGAEIERLRGAIASTDDGGWPVSKVEAKRRRWFQLVLFSTLPQTFPFFSPLITIAPEDEILSLSLRAIRARKG